MTHHQQLAFWRLALVGCMVAVMVLSLLSTSQALPTTGWDKSNHLLGIATLSFLSHWAWPGRTTHAVAALLAYGCLIEVLQSFTPDRSADLADVVADGVGLAIGAVIATAVSALAKVRR